MKKKYTANFSLTEESAYMITNNEATISVPCTFVVEIFPDGFNAKTSIMWTNLPLFYWKVTVLIKKVDIKDSIERKQATWLSG